jgi:hypothetical protein
MAAKPNPLERYFRSNQDRQIWKWMHYFEIYERHFSPYRKKAVTIVEFGVFHGGSLQMWKDYFGRKARIVGIDIDPRCKAFAEDQVEVIIGDMEDREFLRQLRSDLGPIDVLVDDGGHTMMQQITAFEEMWPGISDGGVYLVEDLHTSYWPDFEGGLRKPGTFIEFAKRLIDQQHAWHSMDAQAFVPDEYTRSIKSIHSYDSIMVFDKGTVSHPYHLKTGSLSH